LTEQARKQSTPPNNLFLLGTSPVLQDAEVQAIFLIRIVSRKMFLRRIDYVKYIYKIKDF
jgi:hypothetical protein